MAVTNYYTVEDQMIGYKDGGGQKDFLTDYLGSVLLEIDQTCTKTYDGGYKPYGGEFLSTGSRGVFGWVGTWGYRNTGASESGLKYATHYVRARHYSQSSGMWTTVDPLWPRELPYGYVNGMPTRDIDPTGKWNVGFRNCDATKMSIVMKRLSIIEQLDAKNELDSFYECIDDHIAACRSTHGRTPPSPVIQRLIAGIPTKLTDKKPIFDLIIECTENCIEDDRRFCGHAYKGTRGNPPKLALCIPDAFVPTKCGKLECTILHELVHIGSNYVGHSGESDSTWTDCMPKIPGCRSKD